MQARLRTETSSVVRLDVQFSRIPEVPIENSPVDRVAHSIPLCPERGSGAVVKLGEVVMILDLHRQGLTVSAIARELGIDRKTVRKCITRGLEPPAYGPRKPRQRVIEPFVPYLRERVMAYIIRA